MLSARSLTFERYYHPVFKPLDVTVAEGECLLLTGANGSGKTTLLRLLAGLLQLTDGRIEFTDELPIAFLGHHLALNDSLSARENLQFFARFQGADPAGLEPLLDALGLAHETEQLAGSLSAGQRKRLAFARVMLSPARLWLLDEPYANLDTEGIALIDRIIESHLNNRGAAILASHGELKPQGFAYSELAIESAGY